MDKIRCPACRGSKKVAKLGGIIGDCNTCSGSGQINACDKPVPVITIAEITESAIISQVADCVPTASIPDKFTIEVLHPIEPDIKVDPKKAIYKRKTR